MLPLFPAGEDHVKLMRDCIEFTLSQRQSDAPFDVVYMGDPSIPNRDETAAAFAGVGVTWYFEAIHSRHFGTDVNAAWDVEAMRVHIRSGPPHLK
jgi:hypothetical protein